MGVRLKKTIQEAKVTIYKRTNLKNLLSKATNSS